jgi:hypothetical protein
LKLKNIKKNLQEWDASFFDPRNKTLYLAEAKHKMKLDHLDEVKRKLTHLRSILTHGDVVGYELDDVQLIRVILAAGIFEPDVCEQAKWDIAPDTKQHARVKFHFCETSGDRYVIREWSKTIRDSGSASKMASVS